MLEGARTRKRRVREAKVTNGLYLLLFIAVLVALGLGRFRRRLGIGVTWRTYIVTVLAFCVVGLALWAYSTHR
jgi:hypothetical protein